MLNPVRDSWPPMPWEMVTSAVRHRSLIRELFGREISARFRGSLLGAVWFIAHPVLMLAIYTFVFSVVFNARWQSAETSDVQGDFALALFAGLIVFNLFAECLNKAPGLILSNISYVKKVVFPLEVLPWVTLFSALVQTFASLCVWVLFYLFLFGVPKAGVVMFPIVMLPLCLTALGQMWLLSGLSVYLRDVSQVVGVLTTALLFMSPIFYPVSALPDFMRAIMQFNPLTVPVEQARAVLMWDGELDWLQWGTSLAVAFVGAWVCFAFFQKVRRGFADVL